MSFSADTKIALSREIPEKDCCLSAMLAGMVLFAAVPDGGAVIFKTEVPEVSDVFGRLFTLSLIHI